MLNVLSRPASALCRWSRLFLFALGIALPAAAAQQNMAIYTDSLQNSWDDWSYSVTRNFGSTAYVHSGSAAIAVTLTGAWGALSLHHSSIDTAAYTNLTFWINGGASGGQQLQVYAELSGSSKPAVSLPTLSANSWQQITLSLASLGVANQPDFVRFSIQDRSGSSSAPTYYVDDITLVTNGAASSSGTNSVTINVDAQMNRHAVDPMIYGTAFATAAQLLDLNFTMNRSGGNSETRYNWLLNAHNRANDWYYESIGDNPATAGAAGDDHITQSKNGGAEPLISIPMIEWMPKLGPNREKLASYSTNKYGPQTGNDASWMPEAGNGVRLDGSLIVTNDPNDANFHTNSAFQEAWVRHLTNRWGMSTNGGVRYYIMDNEHSIWHSTHRDVHPVGATMVEIRDKMFEYAGMVKSNDPNAVVLGPEEFGWSGFFYSGYDLWYGSLYGWGTTPDRSTNGGWDYMPWLLNQFRQRATNTNQRLLDYFTLHCYPEDNNVAGTATDDSTQRLRNRLTRKFWDTNYVDETWIGSQSINIVKLIPRMKDWVNAYYPGTKLGITEYNWGAEHHINGATAQADILGIFGREGLDLATRWTTPTASTPTYKAMKMYRNYDGNMSTFGDVSVRATAPDPNTLTAYAAQRSSDGALTLMVVNKNLDAAGALTVNLTNFVATGTAQVWQLTSANTINQLGNISFSGNVFTSTVPIQSVTLFVLPQAAALPPPAPVLSNPALTSPTTFTLRLNGEAGRRYAVESSDNLLTWSPQQTNILVGTSTNFVVPAPGAAQFYRARWVP